MQISRNNLLFKYLHCSYLCESLFNVRCFSFIWKNNIFQKYIFFGTKSTGPFKSQKRCTWQRSCQRSPKIIPILVTYCIHIKDHRPRRTENLEFSSIYTVAYVGPRPICGEYLFLSLSLSAQFSGHDAIMRKTC